MGCAACHTLYSNEGYYEGGDKALPKDRPGHLMTHAMQGTRNSATTVNGVSLSGIQVNTCAACHAAGRRIGHAYQGLMAFGHGDHRGPFDEKGNPQKANGGYVFKFIREDVHFALKDINGKQAGLLCQDCHLTTSMHGNGNIGATTLATITYQNFFRLYTKLAGMTGTAKTEEEEFLSTYNMRVIEIPTNRPIARIDYPDAIFATKKLKFQALANEVKELHEKGQPVLVGTIAVETSELVSGMLRKMHIPHEVLNAKNHAREAEIIAKAGQVGAVTIATNMAGRGTDIKLSEESRALGGLAVLGSERHESRRIDNQLRGRSGRQGDPGFSRFYVSLEDSLMVRFGGEKLNGLFNQLGDQQIESKMVTKSITQAQKRVEGYNFDMRKQLLEYDDVLRKQREIMYEQRNYVLENDDVHDIVKGMFDRVVSDIVGSNTDSAHRDSQINYTGVCEGLDMLGMREENRVTADEIKGKDREATVKYCVDKIFGGYEKEIEPVRQQFMPFEKTVVLRNEAGRG